MIKSCSRARIRPGWLTVAVSLVFVQTSVERVDRSNNFLLMVNDICTGALLSRRHVLVSADCAKRGEPNQFVRFGINNASKPENLEEIPIVDIKTNGLVSIVVLGGEISTTEPVFIYRKNNAKLSVESNLRLVGWDAAEGFSRCGNLKRDNLISFEPDRSRCGYSGDETLVCTKFDSPDDDCNKPRSRCRGILIDLALPDGSTSLKPVLVGVPNQNVRCLARGIKSFVDVSKFDKWLIRTTNDTVRFFPNASKRSDCRELLAAVKNFNR